MRLRRCDRRPAGRRLTGLTWLTWAPAARIPSVALLVALTACGNEPESSHPGAPGEGTAVESDPLPISGIYDVGGVTTPLGGGEERRITGSVILKQDGATYSATFKLDTTFPGRDEPLQADVIGSGQGSISGRTLTGSTKTQLVIATIPGIDTEFAFIPRIVGARIVSSSLTEIAPDGRVVIELQNHPAEGEDYQPTRTRLTGLRVSDSASSRPPVGAPVPGN